jgi:hypothetical protein
LWLKKAAIPDFGAPSLHHTHQVKVKVKARFVAFPATEYDVFSD